MVSYILLLLLILPFIQISGEEIWAEVLITIIQTRCTITITRDIEVIQAGGNELENLLGNLCPGECSARGSCSNGM